MGDIPGVPGLFVAGVFSGALSTVSSGLNSLAAVWLKDFVESTFGLEISDKRKVVLTKVLSAGFGVLSYVLIYVVKYLPGVLEAALTNDHQSATAAIENLTEVAESQPRLFKTVLPQVVEGMASLALSLPQVEQRICAAELLLTLAEAQPKM